MSNDLYNCSYCGAIFSIAQKEEHKLKCSQNFHLFDSSSKILDTGKQNKIKNNKKDNGAFPVEEYSELEKLKNQKIFETKFIGINSKKLFQNKNNKNYNAPNQLQSIISSVEENPNENCKNSINFNNNNVGNSINNNINQETTSVLGDLQDLIYEIKHNND